MKTGKAQSARATLTRLMPARQTVLCQQSARESTADRTGELLQRIQSGRSLTLGEHARAEELLAAEQAQAPQEAALRKSLVFRVRLARGTSGPATAKEIRCEPEIRVQA